MPLILNIETATNVCSVTLAKGKQIIANKISYEEKSHSELLTVFIEQIVKEQKISLKDLDAVSVSKGPGSYTGLRIGVSTAKGIAYGIDKPLIAISTLQTMAYQVIFEQKIEDKNTLFCPMIDARRMEVYNAFYNLKGEQVREIKAEIIDEISYKDILDNQKVIFFGDGSNKCKNIITHKNAFFIENITPLSNYMIDLSIKSFEKHQFENVAYFEPFYLKNFIATKPKKNILKDF